MSRRSSSRGFVTIEQIAVAGFGLVLFTFAANIVLFQYARGATRLALDEGVRSAAVVEPEAGPGRCQATADAAMDNLLRGALGRDITITCSLDGDLVRATASGTVPSWVPGVSDHDIASSAVAPAGVQP